MARTPVGSRSQRDSRTALYGYIAAQLAGIPVRAFDEYFRGLGLLLRQDGAVRAGSAHKLIQPAQRPRGRRAPRRTPRETQGVLRDWLLVDELRLDLEVAVVRFPGTGRRQGDLIQALTHVPGVRQVIETAHKRDVMAVVIFAGSRARRELRAHLEEMAERIIWDDVLFESHEPSEQTWRELARAAAADEDLLVTERLGGEEGAGGVARGS